MWFYMIFIENQSQSRQLTGSLLAAVFISCLNLLDTDIDKTII